jgi:hypothetical protein
LTVLEPPLHPAMMATPRASSIAQSESVVENGLALIPETTNCFGVPFAMLVPEPPASCLRC